MQRASLCHYTIITYYYVIITPGSIITHYYLFQSAEFADGCTTCVSISARVMFIGSMSIYGNVFSKTFTFGSHCPTSRNLKTNGSVYVPIPNNALAMFTGQSCYFIIGSAPDSFLMFVTVTRAHATCTRLQQV